MFWPKSSKYIPTQVISSSYGALLKKMRLLIYIHTHTHRAVELYTNHFKKYVFWKRQEGDNHKTNSLESEYILKFTDTVTSLQDHSLLQEIAESQIFPGFCLKVTFLGQHSQRLNAYRLGLPQQKKNFEPLGI